MKSPPERLIITDLIFGAKILQDSTGLEGEATMRTALLENNEEGSETLRGVRASRLGSEGNLVGFAQKPNGTADIVWIPKKNADPA